ncbi:MAG: apolipoprotein N-acyltransferase [Phycisphaerae bacterium]|nr:apolipoprotein N-acyltransferase [Phycisphaerae bacterium]
MGLCALGLIGSVLFAAIWPPWNLWWCVFVAAVPVAVISLRANSAWRAALLVLLTQIPGWLWVQHWMVQLTPPGMALLVLYCAVYVALFAVVLRRIARWTPIATGRVPMALVVPVVWTACEYLRTTLVLGGYPWYPLGLGLIGPAEGDGLLAQSASIFGLPFLSAIAASVAGLLIDWSGIARSQASTAGSPRRTRVLATIAVMAVQAANLVYGWMVLEATAATEGPAVLVVQTDLSVSNKNEWSREDQERDFAGYVRETLAGASAHRSEGGTIDLVVWPETMVPGFGLEPATLAMLTKGRYYPGAIYADSLALMQERLAVPVVVGAPVYLGLRPDPEKERWLWDTHYNSAYLINGPPPYRRYDKLVLTPFGEVMPLISRWEWLEKQLLSLSAPGMTFDLEPGVDAVRFAVPWARRPGAPLRIVTPICFEDTIASVCRELCYANGERAADLMVNLSNDGWFGWSDDGREHHVLHARIRSIELGVPIIRCANTGHSVVIEWSGRISDRIGLPHEKATGTMVRTMSAKLTTRSTIYGMMGDVWPWSMLLATSILLMIAPRGRIVGESPPVTKRP